MTVELHSFSRSALYVGRLVSGFGVGAASMLTPLYVSTLYAVVILSIPQLEYRYLRMHPALYEVRLFCASVRLVDYEHFRWSYWTLPAIYCFWDYAVLLGQLCS